MAKSWLLVNCDIDRPVLFGTNSYFMKKLRSSGYEGVVRWTKRDITGSVEIADPDQEHWSLLVGPLQPF